MEPQTACKDRFLPGWLGERPAFWDKALLILAVVLAYSNTFHAPFLFDDEHRIVDNASIRTAWPPSVSMARTNRPFAMYTFALNYAVHGLDVRGYHAVNLAIHLGAALLLYGLVRRTSANWAGKLPVAPGVALAVAILWAVHPLQTQAVTYVVQRLESLMGLMLLATLYGFARAQDSRRPAVWYTLSVTACALGMGCKEVMVIAPWLVLWYDRAFVASSWTQIVRRRRLYYFCLAATWGVLAWAMLRWTGDYSRGALVSVKDLTPWTYLVSQAGVIAHYLRLCFWPRGLCLDYDWPPAGGLGDVLPQSLLILGLLGVTVWAVFRRPRWGFLGGWFFLILAPTSSIVPIRDLAFEQRMYLPSVAVVAAVVLAAQAAVRRWTSVGVPGGLLSRCARPAAIALLAAVAVALATATYVRNQAYRSPLTMWADVVHKAPHNVRARNHYGIFLAEEGRLPEAIEQFSLALKIKPDLEAVRKNLEAANRRLEDANRPRRGPGNRDYLRRLQEDFGSAEP